jgi:hypothetical protein
MPPCGKLSERTTHPEQTSPGREGPHPLSKTSQGADANQPARTADDPTTISRAVPVSAPEASPPEAVAPTPCSLSIAMLFHGDAEPATISWTADHPAIQMLADLLPACTAAPAGDSAGILFATVPSPLAALVLSTRAQKMVESYTRHPSSGLRGICIAVNAVGAATERTTPSPALRAQAQPGQILLLGDVRRPMEALPGVRLRKAAAQAAVGQRVEIHELVFAYTLPASARVARPVSAAPHAAPPPPPRPLVQPPSPPPQPAVKSAPQPVAKPIQKAPVAKIVEAPPPPVQPVHITPVHVTPVHVTPVDHAPDRISVRRSEPEPDHAKPAKSGSKLWMLATAGAFLLIILIIGFAIGIHGPSTPASTPAADPAPATATDPAATSAPVTSAPATTQPSSTPHPEPAHPATRQPTSAVSPTIAPHATVATPAVAAPAVAPRPDPPARDVAPMRGSSFTADQLRTILDKADQYAADGHYDQAIRNYDQVIANDPGNQHARQGRDRARTNKDMQQ